MPVSPSSTQQQTNCSHDTTIIHGVRVEEMRFVCSPFRRILGPPRPRWIGFVSISSKRYIIQRMNLSRQRRCYGLQVQCAIPSRSTSSMISRRSQFDRRQKEGQGVHPSFYYFPRRDDKLAWVSTRLSRLSSNRLIGLS